MPARVVVVLDDPELCDQTAGGLISAGYDAIAYHDSMDALAALEAADRIEMLITSAEFEAGKPNGLALARMTRRRRPALKVIFANGPETERHVHQDGAFIPTPTTPEAIIEIATKLLLAA